MKKTQATVIKGFNSTDRQTGRPADRQTGRPADRQTGRPKIILQILRLIQDYITGMTDQYAFDEYRAIHVLD